MRNREIKKIGGSLFIQLLKADVDDFGIMEGDKIDIEELFLKKKELEKIKEMEQSE